MKISFLGAGRIARALIEGLVTSHSMDPTNIIVSSQSGISSKQLAQEFGITAAPTNDEAIEAASMIILCMKPAQVLTALTAAQEKLKNKLVISMAAGIQSDDLFQASGGHARILRAMPNTAVRVGKGTIVFSQHHSATKEDFLLVKKLFSTCALIEKVAEEKLDIVTALSGSGPAFALLFLEGLMNAGIQAGLETALARSLAALTLEAAAGLVLKTEQSPEELRKEITSPNGTTAAGLHTLEEAQFSKTIASALNAACQRAQELAITK